jgi:hypothetical protein
VLVIALLEQVVGQAQFPHDSSKWNADEDVKANWSAALAATGSENVRFILATAGSGASIVIRTFT